MCKACSGKPLAGYLNETHNKPFGQGARPGWSVQFLPIAAEAGEHKRFLFCAGPDVSAGANGVNGCYNSNMISGTTASRLSSCQYRASANGTSRQTALR